MIRQSTLVIVYLVATFQCRTIIDDYDEDVSDIRYKDKTDYIYDIDLDKRTNIIDTRIVVNILQLMTQANNLV